MSSVKTIIFKAEGFVSHMFDSLKLAAAVILVNKYSPSIYFENFGRHLGRCFFPESDQDIMNIYNTHILTNCLSLDLRNIKN